MKKLFEFVKENKLPYMIAMTIAPAIYIILELTLKGKVEWYGAIISSILAAMIYTILKLIHYEKVKRMNHIFSKPNQITYLRILLIPIFAIFLLMNKPYIAAFIFIVLALSDILDGYIARKTKQVTSIGKILDPIADKLLIIVALILLIGQVSLWMVIVIIVREVIVTLMRLDFLMKNIIVEADKLGKMKTTSQMIAITAVILSVPYSWWMMLIAVILTVISGIECIIRMFKTGGEKFQILTISPLK